MDRRQFLKISAGALGLLAAGGGAALARESGARALVLVELAGGNDGLNTLVPGADPLYRKLRPSLSLPARELLGLEQGMSMHPALGPLATLWEGGELAWIQGVGYPEPNRSHFRSIEIWETGSDSEDFLPEGWLTRVWEGRLPKSALGGGVVLGQGDVGPLAGAQMRALVMEDPKRFVRQARRLRQVQASATNPALAHVLQVQANILQGAELLEQKLEQAPRLAQRFPASGLGRQLELAARMILAQVPVSVFKVTLGGFDTHAGQPPKHERLLRELAAGLAALRENLVAAGRWGDVLVMTYSEFGRRAAENGSGGTDHGTAAPHLLLGGAVKGGLYGQQPSLSALDRGDLRFTVDFRRLYSTVAREWWKLPAQEALGGAFKPLGLIKG